MILGEMWEHIRRGVRWRINERYGLAVRGLNLSTVKAVKISLDPFYHDNLAMRQFWMQLSAPYTRATNPAIKVTHEIRNDRKPPFFDAQIEGNRRIIFETSGLHISDVLMTFNKLLGNDPIGKAGIRPRIPK
ncbi:hypothetical protein M3Y97_00467300 [Aphelenchoides bicaudatus]|nr:hypothetical protein M3Y97_00467300 [Aphelenchoides bicaudatus]